MTALCLLGLLTLAAAEPLDPAAVPDLVAWYSAQARHERGRDGSRVRVWSDASGHGHDLVDDGLGEPAKTATGVVNGQPVIRIAQGKTFSVTQPFELPGDHTIFLVYAAQVPTRALFTGDDEDRLGLVLRADGKHDQYQHGGGDPGSVFRYNDSRSLGTGFHVTVLARRSGELFSFINGADASSGVELDKTIRVAGFFRIAHTKIVKDDGAGLQLAEMIFFDRFLDDDERNGIGGQLAELYGLPWADAIAPEERLELPPREPGVNRVRLLTDVGTQIGAEAVFLEWTQPQKLEGPFAHTDEDRENTQLDVKQPIRVRLILRLPVGAKADAARVRLMFLINEADYREPPALIVDAPKDSADVALVAEVIAELKPDDRVRVVAVSSDGTATGLTTMGARFTVEELSPTPPAPE